MTRRRNPQQIAFVLSMIDGRQLSYDIPETLTLTPELCGCGQAWIFLNFPDDGECTCGLWEHHIHCGRCGRVVDPARGEAFTQ